MNSIHDDIITIWSYLSLKRNCHCFISSLGGFFFFFALPHRCCKNLLSPAELTDQIFLSLFVLFLVACYSCSYELWCLNFYFKSHSCRKLCFLCFSQTFSCCPASAVQASLLQHRPHLEENREMGAWQDADCTSLFVPNDTELLTYTHWLDQHSLVSFMFHKSNSNLDLFIFFIFIFWSKLTRFPRTC